MVALYQERTLLIPIDVMKIRTHGEDLNVPTFFKESS